MTALNNFIYLKVNSESAEPTIPFSQIPNSIKEVWIDIWEKLSQGEKEKYRINKT